MKLSGREIAIVFHFAGDFFFMVKFSLSRESISADAMPLLTRDSVRASDNNIDKHYHLARFLSPIARKRNTFIYIAFIFEFFAYK